MTQHNRSCIPSPSVSIGNGWESEYPFGVRNWNISSVDVISMATNLAPLPAVLPLASVGMVRIISGAASLSNWTTTGPGNLRRGASESESVPLTETRSQSSEPVEPSMRQIHIFPELESIVVNTIAVESSSSMPQDGSEGCVPRSRTTSQSKSLGVDEDNVNATTVGLSEFLSTTAITNSASPSRSRSANSG